MPVNRYGGLSTDTTLGGSTPSDEIVSSQKALKTYIDTYSGGNVIHNLFDHKWCDYTLSDQSWLNADTFSWQDGTVYTQAYNHLVNDIQGKSATTETVNGTTVTYYLADDGHKIVLAANVSAIETVYSSTGVAWYYVLDTTNQRFKLPRTKWGFTGLRDTVGKYVPQSLPNITGKKYDIAMLDNGSQSGALYRSDVASNTGFIYDGSADYKQRAALGFDASLSNSTYQNNAPVQQKATQQRLYFYVGQFSQSATEQTAGLNSSLFNNKVDLSSSWGSPSSSYTNLTLGASGATYTAPADGYVVFEKVNGTGASRLAELANQNNGLRTISFAPYSSNPSMVFLPVKKGDIFSAYYDSTGTTNLFRFIYNQKTN